MPEIWHIMGFLTILFSGSAFTQRLAEMMDVSVTHLIDQIGSGLNQDGDDSLHHAFNGLWAIRLPACWLDPETLSC